MLLIRNQQEDPLEWAGPRRVDILSVLHGVGHQHVGQGLLPGEGDTGASFTLILLVLYCLTEPHDRASVFEK